MIVTVTQYLVVCDVPGCGKKSGLHHQPNKLLNKCFVEGWDRTSLTTIRCPACVKSGKGLPAPKPSTEAADGSRN